MALFDTVTYNAKGLANKGKRVKVFNYLQDKISHGFCFLQETHSTVACEQEWKNDWGGDIYFSHGSSNSTGVAICFSKKFDWSLIKFSCDTAGRIAILEIKHNDQNYLLINLYNGNSEVDQLNILETLIALLNNHDQDGVCLPIFGGDFNIIFDTILDSSGGNPSLKKRSVSKIISITDNLDVCDIFRISHPNDKRFTFRQKTPLIQRRLDYIFVANNLQEFVTRIDILPSFMSDHSPVLVKIDTMRTSKRGSYGWKFNNSLISDSDFVSQQKDVINACIHSFESMPEASPHLKWEFLKYEMRKFSIAFSKKKVRDINGLKIIHENVVKNYETREDKPSEQDYLSSKAFLDNLIDERTNGAILRSKAQWYEEGEKSSKFFLNLEKKKSVNNTVKLLADVATGSDISDKNDILEHLHSFYSDLFSRKSQMSEAQCLQFLQNIDIPSLSQEHMNSCDIDISITELKNSLFSMPNNKSPGNDGLTVEFYREFWDPIKNVLFDSVQFSAHVGKLSTSQRQAIIKLLEKKDKDKRFIANWRPISLLNVDTKIISKCLAARLVPVLPTIISPDQTAYVKGRFIGESTRLISDILEMADTENLSGYLFTADLEKAFDSIDHNFLIACLKKFGFGPYFINWAKILLNQNESCVMNGGTTTKYFTLARGARQGDPIAAYFFIIVLEIFFILARENSDINGLNILGFSYLLSAYADDTTFFVADLDSIKALIKLFGEFSKFSGLKLNQKKCEVCGIGVKKGEVVALCGFKVVDLNTDSIRVLGVHFSYNKAICHQRNFVDVIKKIEDVIKIWRLRNLTILGKICIFKSLAFSKIVYISYLSTVPSDFISNLELIHTKFIWNNKAAKIKHSTLIGDYVGGGLRDIDIKAKFDSLHLSWIARLYDGNFHPWKLIPTFLFKKLSQCSSSIFQPNLEIDSSQFNLFPSFYRNLVHKWSSFAHSEPLTVSSILSESIWHNRYIKIDNRVVSPKFFRMNQQLFFRNLFNSDGNFISWNCFKNRYSLSNNMFFKWLQLKSSLPRHWVNAIKIDLSNSDILCNFEPHVNFHARIISLDKLKSSVIYSRLVSKINKPPTSQEYYNNKFDLSRTTEAWRKIYLLPLRSTKDTYCRVFQYKILNNILFLNDKLFLFNLVESPLCSLCKCHTENLEHFFCSCVFTKSLWGFLQFHLRNFILLKDLTPQSALLGFFEDSAVNFCLSNHLLIIFKTFLFKYRTLNPTPILLLSKIKQVILLERSLCHSASARLKFDAKWRNILSIL